MDETLKALLLLNSLGCDGRAWERFKMFGCPARAIWEDSARFQNVLFSENIASRIAENERSGLAEKEFELCSASGVRLLCYGAENYPEPLYDLTDPPLIIYWKGSVEIIPQKTVGVVGTRRASAYGRRVSYGIGSRCVSEDIAVISGGAAGIDGEAHTGASEAGGVTFAVFGTGVDVAFPAYHQELFERISANGAVMSEFPLGSKGEAWHFPRRNRIVAALSQRLVVVEAPIKSGAMITAKISLDLGREIWAVPGRITESTSEGTNKLIFDGAYPLIDMDTFFGTSSVQSTLFDSAGERGAGTQTFSADEVTVISAMRRENDLTVDNIALEAKMSAADVLKIIAVLSARGIVCSSGPGRFSINI